MKASLRSLLVAALILSGQVTIDPQSRNLDRPKADLIREEQKIVVNGIPEIWRLEWKSPPKPSCGPEPDSLNCPCIGFAYGEGGQIDLVRIENGREIDRLELTPFFTQQDSAIIQRWHTEEKDDTDAGTEGFEARVRTRPIVRIMQFADYNHDGKSTEFFLQTDAEPCGKITGVVVGLAGRNPRLHAFGTVLHPDKPLVMHKHEWDALLKATSSVEVLDWPCFDHGSDTETDLELHATNGTIQAIRREFECTESGGRGKLLREQPF